MNNAIKKYINDNCAQFKIEHCDTFKAPNGFMIQFAGTKLRLMKFLAAQKAYVGMSKTRLSCLINKGFGSEHFVYAFVPKAEFAK